LKIASGKSERKLFMNFFYSRGAICDARESVRGFKNLLSGFAIAAPQHMRRLIRPRGNNGLSGIALGVFI